MSRKKLGSVQLAIEVSPFLYISGDVWGEILNGMWCIDFYSRLYDMSGIRYKTCFASHANQDTAIMQALNEALSEG